MPAPVNPILSIEVHLDVATPAAEGALFPASEAVRQRIREEQPQALILVRRQPAEAAWRQPAIRITYADGAVAQAPEHPDVAMVAAALAAVLGPQAPAQG